MCHKFNSTTTITFLLIQKKNFVLSILARRIPNKAQFISPPKEVGDFLRRFVKMETAAKLGSIYHWVHLLLFSGTCLLVPMIYLLMDVLLLSKSVIYSKITDRNVAKLRVRAKMAATARTAAKEAPTVIDAASQATLSWAYTRCEALHNLLVADDAPEVRKKVIPAFAEVLKAVKAWEKAKSMCRLQWMNLRQLRKQRGY
jgi:hypothetical protein